MITVLNEKKYYLFKNVTYSLGFKIKCLILKLLGKYISVYFKKSFLIN